MSYGNGARFPGETPPEAPREAMPGQRPSGLLGALGGIRTLAHLKKLLDPYYAPANIVAAPGATSTGNRSLAVSTGTAGAGGAGTPTLYVTSINGLTGDVFLALGGSAQHVYNVQNAPFNAVGNGTADDTAAIQSAINAAQSDTFGGTVFLPGGAYKVSSSLSVTNPVVIAGEGNLHPSGGTQIRPTVGTFDVIAASSSNYGLVVRDLAIVYAGAAPPGAHYGISVASVASVIFGQVRIENVAILGTGGGVSVLGGAQLFLSNLVVRNVNPGDAIVLGAVTEVGIANALLAGQAGAAAVGLHLTSAFAGNLAVVALTQHNGFRGLQLDAGATGTLEMGASSFAANSGANFVDGTLTGTAPPVATMTRRIANTLGINPFFVPAQPYAGAPASTTSLTNPYPCDMSVYISANGNVSVVSVNGTNLLGGVVNFANLPPLHVRVPAGATISVTYTAGSLTWGWFP